MIALFPPSADDQFELAEAVAAEQRPAAPGRPWIMTNMIASADGATAISGLSGPLGGPADKAMFSALRGVADAIIVGASTVRQERYRPPLARHERGTPSGATPEHTERPLIAVVTAGLSLDPSLPLFSDPSYRPLVITVASAPSERKAALAEVADIEIAGDELVDLSTAIRVLADRGANIVLSEGGPSLNGQFIADGLIDEWNLTLAPLVAGGTSKRPAVGADVIPAGTDMELKRVWHQDDLLFCRWIRSRPV